MPSLVGLGQGMFEMVATQGKWALFLILGVEEAGVPLPIPGDLILSYAGYHISQGKLDFLPAFLYSLAGVTIGSTFLYFIFRFGGRPFVYKYGKYILLPQERVIELEKWFTARGRTAILIGRFIPGLRVFLSGIAGLLNLNFFYFLPQILIASSLWILLFMGIGYFLGEKWAGFAETSSKYGFVFFIIFLVSIAVYIWKHRPHPSLPHHRPRVVSKQRRKRE